MASSYEHYSDLWPAHFNSYATLLDGLKKLATRAETTDAKARVIKTLVHQVEVKSTGIRIHFYAGEQEIKRALTATESSYAAVNKNILVRGSANLWSGGGWTKLFEPLTVVWEYPYPWRRRPVIDCSKLAKLRNVEGWTQERLAERFGRSRSQISKILSVLP